MLSDQEVWAYAQYLQKVTIPKGFRGDIRQDYGRAELSVYSASGICYCAVRIRDNQYVSVLGQHFTKSLNMQDPDLIDNIEYFMSRAIENLRSRISR